MLGKLIKYEWKRTYKVCGALILFVVACSILMGLSLQTPFWKSVFTGSVKYSGEPFFEIMQVMGILVYVIALVGTVFGMMIYLAVHFYKTMYSDEGYLTHTLPVTPLQLLNSKLLVSGLWYLITSIVIILSVAGVILSVVDLIARANINVGIWELLFRNWNDFVQVLKEAIELFGLSSMLQTLVMGPISAFFTIMTLFGAITLGQLSKYKVMMSILWYFAIAFVDWIINTVVVSPILYFTMEKAIRTGAISRIMQTSNIANFLVSAVVAISLYLLSKYIITHRLNLE